MKAVVVIPILGMLMACATSANNQLDQTPTTSEYVANHLPDGSIELIVTATTSVPTPSNDAKLELGAMLEEAAATECPSGYDLSQDPAPSWRTVSRKLIATFRGVARCK